MLGKEKCRILKEIRRKIADENDIPYVTRECHFQGKCKGSCPRCESELRYLEQQLALRAALGKRVAVAALCAGVTLSAAGCAPFGSRTQEGGMETELSGAVAPYEETQEPVDPSAFVTTGEIAYPEDEDCREPCDADLPPEESELPVTAELTGDVAYPEPSEGNG